jgi:hypothetical protein
VARLIGDQLKKDEPLLPLIEQPPAAATAMSAPAMRATKAATPAFHSEAAEASSHHTGSMPPSAIFKMHIRLL